MLKGLFFSLPSTSINNTLTPVIDHLAARDDYRIVYYNTIRPKGEHHFSFKAYPAYQDGYNSNCLDAGISFYRFAETLIDTAAGLLDFLQEEVEKESPDFILHPHLAIWGKLIAAHYKLPAILLSTTFMMDPRIMQPQARRFWAGGGVDPGQVSQAVSYFKKMTIIRNKLGLKGSPDIWDACVNREDLNISFILKEFQPLPEMFGPDCRFAGFPLPVQEKKIEPDLIYISLGTMLNTDIEFYKSCIEALRGTELRCILSVGYKTDIPLLGPLPGNVSVARHVDQVAVLTKAALFITSGGMASIHEAVYTATPMIVIPQTTEQYINALRVEELGIGLYLPRKDMTADALCDSIRNVMQQHASCQERIRHLLDSAPSGEAKELSFCYIDKYLKTYVPASSGNSSAG